MGTRNRNSREAFNDGIASVSRKVMKVAASPKVFVTTLEIGNTESLVTVKPNTKFASKLTKKALSAVRQMKLAIIT